MKIQAVVIALAVTMSIDAAPTPTGTTLSKSANSNDKRSTTGFNIFDISARLMGRDIERFIDALPPWWNIVDRNAAEEFSSERRRRRRRSVGTYPAALFCKLNHDDGTDCGLE